MHLFQEQAGEQPAQTRALLLRAAHDRCPRRCDTARLHLLAGEQSSHAGPGQAPCSLWRRSSGGAPSLRALWRRLPLRRLPPGRRMTCHCDMTCHCARNHGGEGAGKKTKPPMKSDPDGVPGLRARGRVLPHHALPELPAWALVSPHGPRACGPALSADLTCLQTYLTPVSTPLRPNSGQTTMLPGLGHWPLCLQAMPSPHLHTPSGAEQVNHITTLLLTTLPFKGF